MISERVAAANRTGVKGGDIRFAFGRNWRRFLRYLSEERIADAEKSLCEMLEMDSLQGKSFLDVGSGSGLFSLAALRLGAAKVHSFDYDPESVACTEELRRRYFGQHGNWTVETGNVLDAVYLSRLGQFDIVYSWGVLHHTGNMWQAFENIVTAVAPEGKLLIGIYNDQGIRSSIWRVVKRNYNRWPVLRPPVIAVYAPCLAVARFLVDLGRRRNPFSRYRRSGASRGMSYFTDMLDWLGGYPFEVARPTAIVDCFRTKGFELYKLQSVGRRSGVNEYLFRSRGAPERPASPAVIAVRDCAAQSDTNAPGVWRNSHTDPG